MQCRQCAHNNPAGSLYCQKCGGLLGGAESLPPASASACPRCGTKLVAGVRFCQACGLALESAPSFGAPAAAAPIAASPSPTTPRLVALLKDGSDGVAYPLHADAVDIGQREGDIILADDPYLSPRHARIRRHAGGFVVQDLDSVNGVYLRLRAPQTLAHGDSILVGQQLLRFEILRDAELPLGPASVHGVTLFGTPEVPRVARLVQYTTEGVGRDVHYLYRGDTILGREIGDIVFTDDPFLSRRHASISLDPSTRRLVLTDMDSSNGTALRIHGEQPLVSGDQFRVGKHLFRLDADSAPGIVRQER